MSLVGLVKGRVYYGWIVLAGSVAATAIGAGVSIWSFGLYVEPLEDEFGWSRAQVSAGFSISLAAAGIAGPLVGRWIDLRGPRVVILTGAILTAVTYALLALTSSLWQWFFFLSINAVFRQMMFFIPFMALISRWFAQKRGVALGILGAGFSMGAFVAVAVEAVISEFGWEASFIFSAIVTIGFFVPISLLLIRDNPEDVGEYVDGEPQTKEDRASPPLLQGMSSREAMRTPLFWFIAVAMTLFLFGVFGWIVHQVPFYESIGVSRSTAAQIVALTAAGGIFSRLGFGFIVHRFRRVEIAAMWLLAFLMTGMLVLSIDTSAVAIAIFVVVWVVGSGGGPLLEPLLLTRAFGLSHFATILGLVGVIETAGIIASPLLAGVIFDATDSYDLVLVMLGVAFAGSFVLFYMASRLRHPMVEADVKSEALSQ